MALLPRKRKRRQVTARKRPPPHVSRSVRSFTSETTIGRDVSDACGCRWELRHVGIDGILLSLQRPDGKRCYRLCPRRDYIVAGVHATLDTIDVIAHSGPSRNSS